MKIRSKNLSIWKAICIFQYYAIARHLPQSNNVLFGKLSKSYRYFLVKRIFKSCGKNVNVEKGAFFESGLGICIGDNSGIGVNCFVPSDTVIGDNVMMGPECYFLSRNDCQ